MAEERGTQGTTGQATEPGATDPGHSTTRAATTATTVAVPLASPQIDYAAEIAALRQTSERHKQQLEGSAAEARRLKEENEALKASMQQNQQVLQNLGVALSGGDPHASRTKPKDLAEAVNRYLAGEDGALQGLTPVTSEDVNHVVDQRLSAHLAYMGRQQAVFTAHPELTNPKDPLYGEVFALYDRIAAEPLSQMLYPADQGMMMQLASPDGTSLKNVDKRIVDRAMLIARANQARLAGAADETRRQAAGDVAGATGRATTSQGMQVEAIELLTSGEIAQFQDPDFVRALRHADSKMPTDIKGIAKWLWEGMPAAEKARRLEAYRSRGMRGVA